MGPSICLLRRTGRKPEATDVTSRRSIVSVAVTSRHLIETKITTSHESRDAARALALSLSLSLSARRRVRLRHTGGTNIL